MTSPRPSFALRELVERAVLVVGSVEHDHRRLARHQPVRGRDLADLCRIRQGRDLRGGGDARDRARHARRELDDALAGVHRAERAGAEHPARIAGRGRRDPQLGRAVDADRRRLGDRELELARDARGIAPVEDRARMRAGGDDRAQRVAIDRGADLHGVDAHRVHARRELGRIALAERRRAVADDDHACRARRGRAIQGRAEIRGAERAVRQQAARIGRARRAAIDLGDVVVERGDRDLRVRRQRGDERAHGLDLPPEDRRARRAGVGEDQHAVDRLRDGAGIVGRQPDREPTVERGRRITGHHLDDDVLGRGAVARVRLVVTVAIDRHREVRDHRQPAQRERVAAGDRLVVRDRDQLVLAGADREHARREPVRRIVLEQRRIDAPLQPLLVELAALRARDHERLAPLIALLHREPADRGVGR